VATVTTDYGSDLAGIDDLDPMAAEVNGRPLLMQRLARRLMTPPGGSIDAPNDGYDVREELNNDLASRDLARISQRARAELLKDEAVVEASVSGATFAADKLRLPAVITDGDGPFPLVFDVSKASVAVLEAT
jgi:hypothetical protein